MTLLKTMLIAIICLGTNYSNSQTKKTSFLIIESTKNYGSALKQAKLASQKLGWELNLNNNTEDKEEGLTNSDICGCGESHGYFPRGRYDAGNYVSIEYSSYFEGFAKGYYIVVVSSGDRAIVKSVLTKAQAHYKSAYIKDSDVYIGCMH